MKIPANRISTIIPFPLPLDFTVKAHEANGVYRGTISSVELMRLIERDAITAVVTKHRVKYVVLDGPGRVVASTGAGAGAGEQAVDSSRPGSARGQASVTYRKKRILSKRGGRSTTSTVYEHWRNSSFRPVVDRILA